MIGGCFYLKAQMRPLVREKKLNACCIRQHRHLYLATELRQIFGTARIVCKEESMNRYDVRPSVCPIRPLQQRAAALLRRPRWVRDID